MIWPEVFGDHAVGAEDDDQTLLFGGGVRVGVAEARQVQRKIGGRGT